MKKRAYVLMVIASASVAPSAFAATVPCEDMLKELRTAESAATLTDADKAKISDLEAKGIERCNADDDKRADDFFAKALKVLGN